MRKKYLDFLAEVMTDHDGKERPRARHPMKWHLVKSTSMSGEFLDLENTEKTVWIWSDHHFRHERIIEMCQRPFSDTDNMLDVLIENFNNTVKEGDICIWAGDITFKCSVYFNEEIMPLFKKCYNIQVVGNHDFNKKLIRELNFDESHLLLDLKLNNKRVVISHYPFGKPDENFINVHGHIHNYDSEFEHQINICIDKIGFFPVKLNDVI
jgi:calcineurin-like phosphoesterase family protein